MTRQFEAAVVGLGRIGQGYDHDAPPDGDIVLTHASAFASHFGFNLTAGVDPDPDRRRRFERRFGRPAYGSVAEAAARHRIDVWSIAVPTDLHARVLDEVLEYGPRAVLCEKPIAVHADEGRRMVASAARAGCSLLVNYMRRFEPGVLELRRRIAAGALGTIVKGTVWYSHGLLNNGSHFIDLLRFMVGECTDVQVVCPSSSTWLDLEVDVLIRFAETPVFFLTTTAAAVSVGEMVLVGTNGLVRYARGGSHIEITPVTPDRFRTGQHVLAEDVVSIPNELARYQWHATDALWRHLVAEAPLDSNGVTAVGTLEVVDTARRQLAERTYA